MLNGCIFHVTIGKQGNWFFPSSQKWSHPRKCPIRKQNCTKQASILSCNFITSPMNTKLRELYFSFYIKQLHLKSEESKRNTHWEDVFYPSPKRSSQAWGVPLEVSVMDWPFTDTITFQQKRETAYLEITVFK